MISSGVSTWWYNEKPPIVSVRILIDPINGRPFCIILESGYVLGWHRTGSAGAIAAKYLARKNSKVAGMIGAGSIARAQMTHLIRVREIEKILVFDISEDARHKFAKEMSQKLGVDVIAVDTPEKTVRNADILVSATPSTKPIVKADWIDKGLHINAIGADTPQKREYDGTVLKKVDKLYVDEPEKVFSTGEFLVPMKEGIITKENITGTIGELCAGLKRGRQSDSEITLFKSTGMEIQGILLFYEIYKRAREMGLGRDLSSL